jgi:mono/diheme cytochrome c family protein
MRALNITLALAWALWVGGADLVSAQHARVGLGTPATPDQIRGWDIDVRPDGVGLPAGTGTVEKGEKIYAEQCAACHGENGENPAKGFDRLAGGKGTLSTPRPVRTVGSNWAYAATIFDYVRRAMPFTAPQSLAPDEVYSVVAYLLYINDIVPREAALDAQTLPKVKMPNADGFIPDGRPDVEGMKCNADCK